MQKKSMLKGYIYVILSAFIFGIMPLMAKLIYAEGVNSLSLVFLRNCLSFPVLGIIAKVKGNSFKIPTRVIPSISIISIVGCAITPLLLFSSYKYIDSGTATVFHFIYPAIVVLIEFIFLKKKIKGGTILSLIICLIGICLFYTPGKPINASGSFYALLSGVTYATYIVLLASFKMKEISPFVFSFYVASICSAVMFLVCLLGGQLMLPQSISGWILSLVFAVAINVGAVVLFQSGTFIVGGERASILSTCEPITSVFAGAIVFNEIISLSTAIGTVLVILASILITVLDMKKKNHQKKLLL